MGLTVWPCCTFRTIPTWFIVFCTGRTFLTGNPCSQTAPLPLTYWVYFRHFQTELSTLKRQINKLKPPHSTAINRSIELWGHTVLSQHLTQQYSPFLILYNMLIYSLHSQRLLPEAPTEIFSPVLNNLESSGSRGRFLRWKKLQHSKTIFNFNFFFFK